MNSVFLNAGILADGGSFNLFLGTPANASMVTWDSQLGGTFNGGLGTGAVHFTNGEILINGNNTFRNFYADIAADSIGHPVTIYFQQGKTQTVSSNFHVLGTSTIAINLESDASLGIIPKGFYNPPNPQRPHRHKAYSVRTSPTGLYTTVATQHDWRNSSHRLGKRPVELGQSDRRHPRSQLHR